MQYVLLKQSMKVVFSCEIFLYYHLQGWECWEVLPKAPIFITKTNAAAAFSEEDQGIYSDDEEIIVPAQSGEWVLMF